MRAVSRVVFGVSALVDAAQEWLRYVELGGAMLVALAVGIVLGEIATEDLERIATVVNIISTGVCVTLSAATVYFLRSDRRHHRYWLLLIALGTLGTANAIRLHDYFPSPVHDIMFGIASVLTVVFLMLEAAQGRFRSHRKGEKNDSSQCWSPPWTDGS